MTPHVNAARVTEPPQLHCSNLPDDAPAVVVTGDWTTLRLAERFHDLQRELMERAAHPRVRWDLSHLAGLDQTGALLLWRAWGRALPPGTLISASLQEHFAHLTGAGNREPPPTWSRYSVPAQAVMGLGQAAESFLGQLQGVVSLLGRLALDLTDLALHPGRWPHREISAGIYRAGVQALGVLALVGFLIGIVLSYLSGDQLGRLGAQIYVVNLLGIGCIRELGPLLAAILVAGRSGSAMTAQLGVMRLNEELDALTTIGIRYTQRLILPRVIALAVAQPLVGLWTSGIALLGGMVSAHRSLGIGYSYFLDTLPRVVPVANYWIGLGKGGVFGVIIALVACHFGLRVKPDTESLGAGTTTSVVVAISSVLVADALFAVLFAHVGV